MQTFKEFLTEISQHFWFRYDANTRKVEVANELEHLFDVFPPKLKDMYKHKAYAIYLDLRDRGMSEDKAIKKLERMNLKKASTPVFTHDQLVNGVNGVNA